VGTCRNLRHYPPGVTHLTALNFRPAMLQHARRRAQGASCPVLFVQDDVCTLSSTLLIRSIGSWPVFSAACCRTISRTRRSLVDKVYSARFDRNTLEHAKNTPGLKVTATRFIKHDTYLLIEGICDK
jgi:hypothetical protein